MLNVGFKKTHLFIYHLFTNIITHKQSIYSIQTKSNQINMFHILQFVKWNSWGMEIQAETDQSEWSYAAMESDNVEVIRYMAGIWNLSGRYVKSISLVYEIYHAGLWNLSGWYMKSIMLICVIYHAGICNLSVWYMKSIRLVYVIYQAGMCNLSGWYMLYIMVEYVIHQSGIWKGK